MQTVTNKYWSINVRPSKPTKYTPAQNVRLTNVALDANLKDESTANRTSLRVSAHGMHSVICSLTPTKIDPAVVDIVLAKGAEFIFEVVGHNDLSLSGYEFSDNDTPWTRPDSPQETNEQDQSREGEPTDLVIMDTLAGTGPQVEKTSVVRFIYMIIRTDGKTVVNRNDQGGDPATIRMNDAKGTMPALTMGLMGMRTGGERRLLVPPHLGRGKRPVDGIGPDESFFLYLKLVGIEAGSEIL